MNKENYFKAIADHYDREAESYDERLQSNKTLQKIRNDFRLIAQEYISGKSILDFGCGTGADLCYFAAKYPGKTFTGIDLSTKMIEQTSKKITQLDLKNIKVQAGTFNHLHDQTFDFIYVFFGALNTVPNINEVVEQLHAHLNDKGRILVTFVNKWYPMGMLAYMRRLKFKKAFERLKTTWWGYSENYLIESKTHYGRQILKVFDKFVPIYKRGFSIIYPAWFQDRIAKKLGSFASKLWQLDIFLSKTPLWSWGEYVLFVFEKK